MSRRPIRTAASPASSRARLGKVSGIEQQQQVDVGRIIELAAAELAQRDHGEALRLRVGDALSDCVTHSLVDRLVGEIGQKSRDLFERQFAGKIAERDATAPARVAAFSAEHRFDRPPLSSAS